jgi:hypothetical protein
LKKILLLVLIIANVHAAHAYDPYGKKHYHIAVHASNPIGLLSKYGGGIEFRVGRMAVLGNYYKYSAIYPGRQISGELEYYLRSRNRHEFYIYAKGLTGDASYNGNQLSFLGYNTDIAFGSETYYGGGAGIGRRFNFGHFFLTLTGGFKYCAFANTIPSVEQHMYNVFYYTGPGAYADLHLQFGLQF